MSNGTAFGGFVAPRKNYYPTPNEWIDICAAIDNLSELKVVQYVIRHTWGFHEFDGTPKLITTDEFMHGRKRQDDTRLDNGTGLSNRSVIDGLRKAIDHNYLICTVDNTDRGRISKSYALNMARSTSGPDVNHLHTENTCEDDSHQMCNIFTSDVKDVHSCGEDVTHRTEKDTLERHLRKTPKEKQPSSPSPDSSAIRVAAIAQRPLSPFFADALVPGNEWETLLGIIPDALPTSLQSSYSQRPTISTGSEEVAVEAIGNMQSSAASTTEATTEAPSSSLPGAQTKDSPEPSASSAQQYGGPPESESKEKLSRTKKPVMPDGNVSWTSETIVQVCEARRERRYPNGAKLKKDRLRDKELAAAEELLKSDMADLWTDDTAYNIRLLCDICTHWETRKESWWLNTNGPMNPHQLLDKDRIHTCYDEMLRMRKLPVRGDVAIGAHTQGGDVAAPLRAEETSRIGVSGRLRVVSSGPMVVVPPKRRARDVGVGVKRA